MAAGKLCFPPVVRHPELVSGSIGHGTRPKCGTRNGAVGSTTRRPDLQAQWTLKQVQGDEIGKMAA